MPLFASIYPFQTQISRIFVCYRGPLNLWKVLNYLPTHNITFLVILLNFAFDEQELFPIYFHFPKKWKAFAKWHLYHDTVCLKWQCRGMWVPSSHYHSSDQNWAWKFSGLHKNLTQERQHYNYLIEDKINTLCHVKVLLSDGIRTRKKPRLTQDSICVSVQMPTPKPNWKAQ